MHDHRVPHLHVGDPRADLVHPAGVLMPGRIGQLDARLLGPLPFLNMEISAAQAGGADPDDHVERPVDLGLVDAVELERFVVGVQPGGFHLATSCGSGASWWRTCSNERQMPPLASRLVCTSRAIRNQRCS